MFLSLREIYDRCVGSRNNKNSSLNHQKAGSGRVAGEVGEGKKVTQYRINQEGVGRTVCYD